MKDSRAVLDEWMFSAMYEQAVVTEKRIRLLLQPRPKWLPEFIWRRIVARLLYIEETLGGDAQ